MKKSILIAMVLVMFALGCNHREIDFKGMSRRQVAEILENGPKRKDGSFRVCHPLRDSPPNTLVHHFYKDKDELLNSDEAMDSSVWQVFFHEDGGAWHSYLIEFRNGVVVSQQDRSQPHWTMAEP